VIAPFLGVKNNKETLPGKKAGEARVNMQIGKMTSRL
jgi:hypothetical protein